MSQPSIFFAFAEPENEKSLPFLREEMKGIQREFNRIPSYVQRPALETTVEDIFNTYLAHKESIKIFHFAGHSNSYNLFLQTLEKKAEAANVKGIAKLLGRYPPKLAFLNGCANNEQADHLLEAGVPAVIATSRAIVDKVAADFAVSFYKNLIGRESIENAFTLAQAEVLDIRGGDVKRFYDSEKLEKLREIDLDSFSNIDTSKSPWELYGDASAKRLKLKQFSYKSIPNPETVNELQKPITVYTSTLIQGLEKAVLKASSDEGFNFIKGFTDFADILEPTEGSRKTLAEKLIHKAFIQALGNLVENNSELFRKFPQEPTNEPLSEPIENAEVYLPDDLFTYPENFLGIRFVKKAFIEWGKNFGCLGEYEIKAIAKRLNYYFAHALFEIHSQETDYYAPFAKYFLNDLSSEPFKREFFWTRYSAFLKKLPEEAVFDEAFSLNDVYINPRAYYKEWLDEDYKQEEPRREHKHERIVVELSKELDNWLNKQSSDDAIRVISGGPGSGKSSFTKIFAAKHADDVHIIWIPLQHFSLSNDSPYALSKYY